MLSDIYETIGHRFFTGLSSPNKALYINCLDSIYAMSEGQISHIHTRERLHQNIESCIAETHAVLYGSDGMEVSDTLSKRASEVMYSLIEYGWLVSEDIEDAFGQNVYLSEPGTALIRFLRALAQPVQKEYTTFIFNMYNALTNRKQWEDNPYALMLKPVYDNHELESEGKRQGVSRATIFRWNEKWLAEGLIIRSHRGKYQKVA